MQGRRRSGDVTLSKSGLAWAGASSGGLRLGISIRQQEVSFPPWPSAETIRELFAKNSSGGTESMHRGRSAACEPLSEVGRVNRGRRQKQWWRKSQQRQQLLN